MSRSVERELNTTGPHKIQMVNDAGMVDIPIADLQRRHVLPIVSIRGVYVQRNQVGLMIDAVACIVGDKPGEAQITIL